VRFFACLLLVFATVSQAQLIGEHVVTKELAVTSSEEAKKKLLLAASLMSVEQHAPELGFELSDFKKKVDQKFNIHWQAFQQKNLDSFVGSEEEKQHHLQQLQGQREDELYRFLRLGDLIQSFAFNSFSANPEDGKTWSASLRLQLDREKMERLLRRITSDEVKQFAKLWVIPEINLNGFKLKDIGLEDKNLALSLGRSWAKFLNDQIPGNLEEVGNCEAVCQEFFQHWQTIPQGESQSPSDPAFLNGLWLRIGLDLRRSSAGQLEWEGRILLLDINTKRILSAHNLLTEKRSFEELEPEALYAQLGSQLYRSPVPHLQQLSAKLPQMPRLNRVSRLVIRGQRHLGEVLSVLQTLRQRGTALGLDVKLSSFQQQEAQVLCFYQGEEKSFSDLLSRLKELKSSQSYMLVSELAGTNYVLRLVTE
jgi:hypothetical protein